MSVLGLKVLLLNPPNFNSRYINRDLMGGLGVSILKRHQLTERLMSSLKAKSIRLPVISLVYTATLLAKEHDVSIVDAANLNLNTQETLQKIEKLNPQWIISTTSIASLFEEVKFLSQLKKRLNVMTVLLGDAATFFFKKNSGRILRRLHRERG